VLKGTRGLEAKTENELQKKCDRPNGQQQTQTKKKICDPQSPELQ
jgi:hypothetical protein